MRVSANGGTPETLVEGEASFPQILPDGKWVIFTDPASHPPRTLVQSLESGEQKELVEGYDAWFLPTGHLVYRLQNNNNLFAIP